MPEQTVACGTQYKTPLVLLTGFLGAGKTTWLRSALADQALGDAAVLVNEFGEIGIDHLLVGAISPDIVLLETGCVCCQIREELKEAILNLFTRRHKKSIPFFRRIVLETTGLAEPAQIFSTLLLDPVLQNQILLQDAVTIVDAVYGLSLHAQQREWAAQVSAATLILLSKTDLAPKEEVAALSAELSRINPTAELATVQEYPRFSDVSSAIFQTAANNLLLSQEKLAKIPANQKHLAIKDTATLSFFLDKEVDWTAYVVWLSALIHSYGEKLLRVKCLLNTSKFGAILLDGVGHTLYPPQHIEVWPDTDKRSRLVFITRGLDTALIKRSFETFVQRCPEDERDDYSPV